jgi:hypothetical protein
MCYKLRAGISVVVLAFGSTAVGQAPGKGLPTPQAPSKTLPTASAPAPAPQSTEPPKPGTGGTYYHFVYQGYCQYGHPSPLVPWYGHRFYNRAAAQAEVDDHNALYPRHDARVTMH